MFTVLSRRTHNGSEHSPLQAAAQIYCRQLVYLLFDGLIQCDLCRGLWAPGLRSDPEEFIDVAIKINSKFIILSLIDLLTGDGHLAEQELRRLKEQFHIFGAFIFL